MRQWTSFGCRYRSARFTVLKATDNGERGIIGRLVVQGSEDGP